MNSIKIIQSSPIGTGSTLLLNLLHGFLLPNEGIHYDTEKLIHKYLITKTHNLDIDFLEKKYSNYKLYFIMSERYDDKVTRVIDNSYRNKENVLIINYNIINETNNNTIDNIINNIYSLFIDFLPKELIPKKNEDLIKKDMKERIILMNKKCEELKGKSFGQWDNFTGIHGSHRNRKY